MILCSSGNSLEQIKSFKNDFKNGKFFFGMQSHLCNLSKKLFDIVTPLAAGQELCRKCSSDILLTDCLYNFLLYSSRHYLASQENATNQLFVQNGDGQVFEL